jgi:hypothetical protein
LQYYSEQDRVFFIKILLVWYHQQRNQSKSSSWFG